MSISNKISDLRSQKRSDGFTIVELMISTAVFSVVLLLLATVIVQVGRIFYKGVTINRTQQTTRKVDDDVVGAIQFGVSNSGSFQRTGGPTTYNGVTVNSVCLGEVRYSYVSDMSLGSAATQADHVLWKDRVGGTAACTPLDLSVTAPPGSSNGQELLGDNMRLPTFTVTAPVSGSNIWVVSVTVAYGDTSNLFVSGSNYGQCIDTSSGGQYCAVSSITSNVSKRL